jgi:dephospho-CoA kinase
MLILGLTGSIGMGKSEATKVFRRAGVPVFDADAAVHELLSCGGRAVPLVDAAFPGAVKDGMVDRPALGAMVFGKPEKLRKLEAILHPRVGQMQRQFLQQAARRRQPLAVLDIPLLFEGTGEERCDVTAVVSAPGFIQRQRVLARPNMTVEKFENIRRQQVPDVIKRQRADYVLPTGLGRRFTLNAIHALMDDLGTKEGRAWPPKGYKARRPSRHPSRRCIHKRWRDLRSRK